MVGATPSRVGMREPTGGPVPASCAFCRFAAHPFTSAGTSPDVAAPSPNAALPVARGHTADGWSTSPAGGCRCSMRRSSRSIWPRGRPRGYSTSRTWAGSRSTGRAASDWLESLLTRRVADIEPGRAAVHARHERRGGTGADRILDDALVTREADAADGDAADGDGGQREQPRAGGGLAAGEAPGRRA